MSVIDFSRSRAILVGTSEYTAGLAKMDAAANSLAAVQALLTGPLCGWSESRVTSLLNRRTRDGVDQQIATLIHDTTDVLLFYYVGHGQLLDGEDLGMALVDTHRDPRMRYTTSLRLSHLRHELKYRCPARVQVVILDCCFSGLATRNTQGADLAEQVRLTTRIEGAYTLAASRASQKAVHQDGGDGLTYFTKVLTEVVQDGIPGAGPYLALNDLHTEIATRFRHLDLPQDHLRPEPTTLVVDTAEKLPLARNAAWAPARTTGEPAVKPADSAADVEAEAVDIDPPSSATPAEESEAKRRGAARDALEGIAVPAEIRSAGPNLRLWSWAVLAIDVVVSAWLWWSVPLAVVTTVVVVLLVAAKVPTEVYRVRLTPQVTIPAEAVAPDHWYRFGRSRPTWFLKPFESVLVVFAPTPASPRVRSFARPSGWRFSGWFSVRSSERGGGVWFDLVDLAHGRSLEHWYVESGGRSDLNEGSSPTGLVGLQVTAGNCSAKVRWSSPGVLHRPTGILKEGWRRSWWSDGFDEVLHSGLYHLRASRARRLEAAIRRHRPDRPTPDVTRQRSSEE
ncbi:caspase domain-containing protein [Umezawaea endophytica]|uniref:Caspase family protein n=1 Tax=Umezawaea endophytica TaxID=1654476 RepID=A0A9X2VTN2_9PSEU|nr:caspase family protein [Umezawaea endophytica]MCS7481373.1 caspase family protein [Umezawaea endophytica]